MAGRQGIKVDCTHPRARHVHGTRLAYLADRCRCAPCCSAASREEVMRLREHENGTFERRQAVGPLADHLRSLMASGLSLQAIASASGVARHALARIISDAPPKYVKASTVKAVRSVTIDELSPRTSVPAVGTVRRLRALVALGWPVEELARRCGLSRLTLATAVKGAPMVRAGTRTAVNALYDELSMTLPRPRTHHQRSAVTAARNRAKRQGWVPPLAWEDGLIDDPDATPLESTPAA